MNNPRYTTKPGFDAESILCRLKSAQTESQDRMRKEASGAPKGRTPRGTHHAKVVTNSAENGSVYEPSSTPEIFYGCKCIFLHTARRRGKMRFYEESVILIKAPDAAIARERASRAAADYAGKGITFCGVVASYPILEDELSEGMEVFSSFRFSSLSPKKYANRFYLGRSCYFSGLPG